MIIIIIIMIIIIIIIIKLLWKDEVEYKLHSACIYHLLASRNENIIVIKSGIDGYRGPLILLPLYGRKCGHFSTEMFRNILPP